MMRTIVVGLGNPILSDDSVGIKVAGQVKALLKPDSGVDVAEINVGGIRLMEAIAGYERAIIVDAMKSGNCPPGTIQWLTLDSLKKTRNMVCAHDGDLLTALELGRSLGLEIPNNVEILGIEAYDVENFSEELTGNVLEALPTAVSEVLSRCAVTHAH